MQSIVHKNAAFDHITVYDGNAGTILWLVFKTQKGDELIVGVTPEQLGGLATVCEKAGYVLQAPRELQSTRVFPTAEQDAAWLAAQKRVAPGGQGYTGSGRLPAIADLFTPPPGVAPQTIAGVDLSTTAGGRATEWLAAGQKPRPRLKKRLVYKPEYVIGYPNDPRYKGMLAYVKIVDAKVTLVSKRDDATVWTNKGTAERVLEKLNPRIKGHLKPCLIEKD